MASNTFSGKPCSKGHGELRYVVSGTCVTCDKERASAWKKANRERSNLSTAVSKRKARAAGRYVENPQVQAKSRAKWKSANPHKVAEDHARRRANKLNATPSWVKSEELAGFYAMAQRISKCTGIPHHVDHIYPLNGKNSRGLHVPWNLQVIPAKLNMSKGNKIKDGSYVGL